MARKTYTKKNNYGCYIINTGSFNEEEKPIYKVGKSTNIIERFKAHRTGSPLATLVKTFPVATDQVDPKNQVNRSAKLNEQEHHIHYSLSSYAFNTEGPGGIEFFCFNNDEEAVDKINEVLGYEKMADNPIGLPKERKKQRKKRRAHHFYQDINLTIKTASREERAHVLEELNHWHCIDKRMVMPTQKAVLKTNIMIEPKVVDEKGRLCWNKMGLPIPRRFRDDYMLTYYNDTVVWYDERQSNILHEDLNDNYILYKKTRAANLANAGIA